MTAAEKHFDEAACSALIERAFPLPRAQWPNGTEAAVLSAIDALDRGHLRIASPSSPVWTHHSWVQKAILCYFSICNMQIPKDKGLPFRDKIDSKFDHCRLEQAEYRVVPPTHVRYGAYIGKQCVLMPCFINIGAYVDDHTMIDTWATVGSGAQIGKSVHISGGVGIGGVLEPPQARPTIIEDGCFIGARSEIAEGVVIRRGAVVAMGTFISQSTKIYDRESGRTFYGEVPENAVVVPGSVPSKTGNCMLNAAIIVKYADAKTREKTSINALLRDDSLQHDHASIAAT